jgi:hypothetical protein
MVFGDHKAVEVHVPLLEQLPQYLEAKGISSDALPGYVVRDQFKLIVPSSADPGSYRLSVSTIDSRMLTIVLDPAPPSQLLPREVTVGYIQVRRPQNGALDPARIVAPGPVGEGR